MNNYCVYEHVFPDGKRYIGITKDVEHRWQNGTGYSRQKKVYDAILKYGWKNIKHNIIVDGLTSEQAQQIEIYLIKTLNTVDEGYNTSIGGENITASYLNSEILAMIRACSDYSSTVCPVKFKDCQMSMPEFANMARYNPQDAEFWNCAHEGVMKKHKELKLRKTDRYNIMQYWWYMREFMKLHLLICDGKDVSKWKELSYGEDLKGILK